jgi:hypothetical protein
MALGMLPAPFLNMTTTGTLPPSAYVKLRHCKHNEHDLGQAQAPYTRELGVAGQSIMFLCSKGQQHIMLDGVGDVACALPEHDHHRHIAAICIGEVQTLKAR